MATGYGFQLHASRTTHSRPRRAVDAVRFLRDVWVRRCCAGLLNYYSALARSAKSIYQMVQTRARGSRRGLKTRDQPGADAQEAAAPEPAAATRVQAGRCREAGAQPALRAVRP